MNKKILALSVLMGLSATAHAADPSDLIVTNHKLHITGSVTVDGCAFQDGTFDDQNLYLVLDEVSFSTLQRAPTTVLNQLDSTQTNTLVCPVGIESVKLGIKPNVGSFDNDVLKNQSQNDPAAGVGFKVAAAFGEDLPATPEWIDFSAPKRFTATPNSVDGTVVVNFGANYVLTDTDTVRPSAGNVEAELPFTISYI